MKIMKEVYPNYLGRMKEVENNISEEDLHILDDYCKFCGLSAGEDKVEQRKRYALQFLDIAEKSFKQFDREVIENIYRCIKETDREITGKNEVIKQLKFFIKWLYEDDYVKLLKGINAIPQRKGYNTKKLNSSTLVKPSEIKALITACRNDNKKIAMISLQTELGLRPHELLSLTWADIKFEEDIGEVKVYANKTKETRVLPFKASVVPLLKWKESYHFPNLKDKDLVFPHPFIRNKKLYRTYLSTTYRNLCKKAGLRNIYPYLARHTKMTEANKKMPSKVASAFGGHSEKTAAMYTHLSEGDIKEVVLKELMNIKNVDIKVSKNTQKRLELMEEKVRILEKIVNEERKSVLRIMLQNKELSKSERDKAKKILLMLNKQK